MTNAPLPAKVTSRKEEIAAGFMQLVDAYMEDLVHQRAERRPAPGDLARALFIHPRHLTNTVKLVTGRSPCDIMEERLVAFAKELLHDPSLSVGDVAARMGYTETTNFIKFFKGLAGTTPLRYRKSLSSPS